MDQQQRLEQVISRVKAHMPLEEIPVDEAISSNDAFLKLVNVSCYRWQAEKIPKIGALRFGAKVPSLDALNMILYPDVTSDAPIFLFFFLVTSRKVICHFNVNTPFNEPEYLAKWVEPLEKVLSNYNEFECRDRYPEWMKKYRRDCTIYGLFNQDRLDELSSCAFEYLDTYLNVLDDAPTITEPERLETIKQFHENFIHDIRTQDKAQGMTSKFIGKEKARRIFYEVAT